MPTPSVPPERRRMRQEVIEDLLARGYHPPGDKRAGSIGAVMERALVDLRHKGDNIVSTGSIYTWMRRERQYRDMGEADYLPDWSKFRPAAASYGPAGPDDAEPTPDAPEAEPVVEGRIGEMEESRRAPPRRGRVKRYICTSAQNNTYLHERFWENLNAFADHVDAEILVATFTYDKGSYGEKAVKRGTYDRTEAREKLWYDPRLEPYMADEQIQLADGLVWCGTMNLIPTRARPLSGFEVFTGRRSGIFPHVRIHVASIPSGKHEPTKFNWTTGTVTVRNYIQKGEGLKAEAHHAYGALLVEIDSDGDWFCRHLSADEDGTFYDLDRRVQDGAVVEGCRVRSITWGDIHVAELDPMVKEVAWGPDGMLDTLQPEFQFLHDVLDFRARSHHEIKDDWLSFLKWMDEYEDVRSEVADVGHFLDEIATRPWCETVVVDSNHHRHLGRWLRDEDGRKDPVNAEFWLELHRHVYSQMRDNQTIPDLLEPAVEIAYGPIDAKLRYLAEDESLVLDDIEYGLHTDRGPNGGRGSPTSLARMGRRMTGGHSHSAMALDGFWRTGTCSVLSPPWVKGPSSWSHTQVIAYQNGKRTHITIWNGKWRA